MIQLVRSSLVHFLRTLRFDNWVASSRDGTRRMFRVVLRILWNFSICWSQSLRCFEWMYCGLLHYKLLQCSLMVVSG